MPEEFLIDIDVDGSVKVEGKGIKGPDCVSLTKEIEAALGEVKSKTHTAEFSQRPPMQRKVGA